MTEDAVFVALAVASLLAAAFLVVTIVRLRATRAAIDH